MEMEKNEEIELKRETDVYFNVWHRSCLSHIELQKTSIRKFLILLACLLSD